MIRAGGRRGRAGVTLAATLLFLGAWAVHEQARPGAAAAHPGGGGTAAAARAGLPVEAALHGVGGGGRPTAPDPTPGLAAAAIPRVGADILPTTLTCARARGASTPTTATQCAAWGVSGPVNVVIVWPGTAAAPSALRVPPAPWRRAAGSWLVATGQTTAGAAGCAPGVHASGEQIELRIDALTRRHLKLVDATCRGAAGPVGVIFGDAHTDHWDIRCGGDHAVDWDAARDALVQTLSRLPSFVRVEYAASPPGTRLHPGGCGRMVPTDGRVAYVVLGA